MDIRPVHLGQWWLSHALVLFLRDNPCPIKVAWGRRCLIEHSSIAQERRYTENELNLCRLQSPLCDLCLSTWAPKRTSSAMHPVAEPPEVPRSIPTCSMSLPLCCGGVG